MPSFSKKSKERLKTCHLDIQRVMNEAILYYDFSIICGHRNKEDQNKAFDGSYSQLEYPRSRHNKVPSEAVDIAPWIDGRVEWGNIFEYYYMAGIIMAIAEKVGVELIWSGRWKSFKEYGHFQIGE